MLVGIFVGGRARRMGGVAKGLLRAPDGEPIVERLARIARELGFTPALVGSDARYNAIAGELPVLADSFADVGPLAGLHALLTAAEGEAIAVACDMPYVSAALLARLAREAPAVDVLAPRSSNGLWEPLCARYRADAVLPVLTAALSEQVRSFQALFRRLSPVELALDEAERAQLRDWDQPEDLPG